MSVLNVLPEPDFHLKCGLPLIAHWNNRFSLLLSFHVGSGCYDAGAFGTAVSAARSVFDLGVSEDALDILLLNKGKVTPGVFLCSSCGFCHGKEMTVLAGCCNNKIMKRTVLFLSVEDSAELKYFRYHGNIAILENRIL